MTTGDSCRAGGTQCISGGGIGGCCSMTAERGSCLFFLLTKKYCGASFLSSFFDENGFQNGKFSAIPSMGRLAFSRLLGRNRELSNTLGSSGTT